MVEWFDDLVLGMRFKSPEKRVTGDGSRPNSIPRLTISTRRPRSARCSGARRLGLAYCGDRHAARTRDAPIRAAPLLGLGVDELRWLAPVRPDDVLHLEGEVVEVTPSRSRPQGIARVKWTAFNQRGEPVYTFTPIAIVPRQPA